MSTEEKAPTVAPKKGRPPKKKNPVGRPKGEATALKEFRSRLINSPRSKKVFDSILSAALDDDHKHQAAAWKLIVDRLAPVTAFEKDSGSTRTPSIQVNISGVPGVDITGKVEEALDTEWETLGEPQG